MVKRPLRRYLVLRIFSDGRPVVALHTGVRQSFAKAFCYSRRATGRLPDTDTYFWDVFRKLREDEPNALS